MATKYKKSIAWKKWVDPFLEMEEFKKQVKEKAKEEGQITQEELDSDKDTSIEGFAMLSTNYGIIPINEHNLPSNNFDFWIGYSNFDLEPSVVDVLNHIPGIEILEVFSRYSFRIGIGRHPDFTFASVRRLINEALCDPHLNQEDEILGQMNTLQEKIKHHPEWAILAMPNGCIQSIYSDTKDDPNFKKQLEIYKELSLGVQAILASSEDKSVQTG